MHVAQTGGEMAPWQADAYLSVGYWTLSVNRPDTISCDDGENHPAQTTYSWDAVALSGWLGAHDPGVCGGDPKSLAAPFTLTKVGAAEIPLSPPAEPAPPPPAEPAAPLPAETPLGAAEMAPPPAETPPAEQ
ncbi:MAG TPA: hypothetical protein VH496_02395 [Mycobacterium sp.]